MSKRQERRKLFFEKWSSEKKKFMKNFPLSKVPLQFLT